MTLFRIYTRRYNSIIYHFIIIIIIFSKWINNIIVILYVYNIPVPTYIYTLHTYIVVFVYIHTEDKRPRRQRLDRLR